MLAQERVRLGEAELLDARRECEQLRHEATTLKAAVRADGVRGLLHAQPSARADCVPTRLVEEWTDW
jgi:hypothetical protein